MLVKEHVIDSPRQKERESPRYPIPSYFNPSTYTIFRAVKRLLDRYDLPIDHEDLLRTFKSSFAKILCFGNNAENRYNDHLKNLTLLKEAGTLFEVDVVDNYNVTVNSLFLKSALNMMRDYIDSITESNDVGQFSKTELFNNDRIFFEYLIEAIETYLHYLIDPDSKIETYGESEESDSSDRAQGTEQD